MYLRNTVERELSGKANASNNGSAPNQICFYTTRVRLYGGLRFFRLTPLHKRLLIQHLPNTLISQQAEIRSARRKANVELDRHFMFLHGAIVLNPLARRLAGFLSNHTRVHDTALDFGAYQQFGEQAIQRSQHQTLGIEAWVSFTRRAADEVLQVQKTILVQQSQTLVFHQKWRKVTVDNEGQGRLVIGVIKSEEQGKLIRTRLRYSKTCYIDIEMGGLIAGETEIVISRRSVLPPVCSYGSSAPAAAHPPSIAMPSASTTASDIPMGQQASSAVWEHDVKRTCWSVMANLNDLTWARILTYRRGPPPALMPTPFYKLTRADGGYMIDLSLFVMLEDAPSVDRLAMPLLPGPYHINARLTP
ncbi:hypothetical protein BDR22DRAFT_827421 [Usnea florida]